MRASVYRPPPECQGGSKDSKGSDEMRLRDYSKCEPLPNRPRHLRLEPLKLPTITPGARPLDPANY